MLSGNEGVLALLLILVLLAILIRPLINQFKGSRKFFWHSLGGLIPLLVLNTFGEAFGIHLPINFATIVISAVFGLPGIILLTILKFLLFKG